MYLELAHTNLDVFTVSKTFVLAFNKENLTFTTEENSEELGGFMIRSFQMISKLIS